MVSRLSGLSRLLAFTLAIQIATATGASADFGDLCRRTLSVERAFPRPLEALRNRLRERVLARRITSFDWETYEAANRFFRENPASVLVSSQIEETMAYLNVQLERANVRSLPTVDAIFESGDLRQLSGLFSLTRKLSFSRGLTLAEIDSLFDRLFLLSNGADLSLLKYGMPEADAEIESALHAYTEAKVAAYGIKKRMAEIGMLNDPTVWSRVRAGLRNPKVQIALSAISWAGAAHGFAGVLPDLRFLAFDDALLEKLLTDGIDAHWAEIESKLAPRFRTQEVYRKIRGMVYVASAVIGLGAWGILREQHEEAAKRRAIDQTKRLNRAVTKFDARTDSVQHQVDSLRNAANEILRRLNETNPDHSH